jgi:type IV secretion system protein VirB5
MSSSFKRPPRPFGASAPVETPYIRAQQVWDDRIGSARAQAANWRLAAFASMAITAVTLGAYIVERSDTHVATYVVPVDQAGRPGRVELAGRDYQPTKAETAYFLADWVGWIRSRSPTDAVVNAANALRAYNFVDGAGRGQLDEMEKASTAATPATPATPNQAVTVQVQAVIQRSPTSYQVNWTETAYREGDAAKVTHWTGLFGTVVKPPRDEAALRRNPLGLFVNSVQISQELA